MYRTQVEYSVSVTCQIQQLCTLMYKKDNYVSVLSLEVQKVYKGLWCIEVGRVPHSVCSLLFYSYI